MNYLALLLLLLGLPIKLHLTGGPKHDVLISSTSKCLVHVVIFNVVTPALPTAI